MVQGRHHGSPSSLAVSALELRLWRPGNSPLTRHATGWGVGLISSGTGLAVLCSGDGTQSTEVFISPVGISSPSGTLLVNVWRIFLSYGPIWPPDGTLGGMCKFIR